MADCLHHFELDTIDPPTTGTQARQARFHCTKCNTPHQILTLKTDAEIAKAVEETNADAETLTDA